MLPVTAASKVAVRAVNTATRGGTRLSLTMATHGEAMRTLAALADLPDSLAAAFLVPDARIVRRDSGIHRIAFLLRHGDDCLRLDADRTSGAVTFAAAKDGALHGERPLGFPSLAAALDIGDPWQGAADPALPVVHVFGNHRIWDAYLQVVRAGMGEERHGRTLLAYRVPGMAVVDPATLLAGHMTVALADEAALPGAHHIQALAELNAEAGVRRYGAALMPPQHADADALFVSFELEKQQWLEQVPGIAGVLNRAHKTGTGFRRLLVNGMTAPWDGRPAGFFPPIEAAEREMIGRLEERLVAPVEVVWMFGWTFAEKLAATRGARFAVAPIGSASLMPNVMGVPGVAYSNRDRIGWIRWLDNERMRRVPATMLNDREEVEGLGRLRANRATPRVSYSIRPADFVPFAMRHYRATAAFAPADAD